MQVYREITPLKETDVFIMLDSFNNGFDYPIHNHPEFEINLILGMSGTRIVGDSTERYNEFDLVLLGPYVYHKWDGDEELQKNGKPYRVITIQFDATLFDSHLLKKEHFYKIRKLLQDAGRGIKFYGNTFTEAQAKLINLTKASGFSVILEFLSLLDLLSNSTEAIYLASEGFDPKSVQSESKRIQIAYRYILKNFTQQSIKIGDVATEVNMSESAFSHFFKKYTNKNFTQFLIDIRIGYACKLLLDTDETINQICFRAGFNNITNFNRLFKKYRSCTPLEYRRRYKEKNDFDWTNQITPYQFLPSNTQASEFIKPTQYRTRLVHS
jgi:AraC-like DNA-binding protein